MATVGQAISSCPATPGASHSKYPEETRRALAAGRPVRAPRTSRLVRTCVSKHLKVLARRSGHDREHVRRLMIVLGGPLLLASVRRRAVRTAAQ